MNIWVFWSLVRTRSRNISLCRNALFGLLGPALSYNCKLSPHAQLHLWRIYALPVLRSGLSALPIRPAVLKSLSAFQNKILRGFLKLSKTCPIPCLYFLTGELPVAARVHLDLLTLFHNIASNPQTKIYSIVKYILMMADNTSTTWSNHIRLICRQYQLPDPLQLLQFPPSKEVWRKDTTVKITAFHEKDLRERAARSNRLKYFNVQLFGLTGKPHPVLQHITETRQAFKSRSHIKLLTGDFVSYELLAAQRGTDPHCRLCFSPNESTQHILTECRGIPRKGKTSARAPYDRS